MNVHTRSEQSSCRSLIPDWVPVHCPLSKSALCVRKYLKLTSWRDFTYLFTSLLRCLKTALLSLSSIFPRVSFLGLIEPRIVFNRLRADGTVPAIRTHHAPLKSQYSLFWTSTAARLPNFVSQSDETIILDLPFRLLQIAAIQSVNRLAFLEGSFGHRGRHIAERAFCRREDRDDHGCGEGSRHLIGKPECLREPVRQSGYEPGCRTTEDNLSPTGRANQLPDIYEEVNTELAYRFGNP
jgi:hypothetical protein